MSKYRIEMHV